MAKAHDLFLAFQHAQRAFSGFLSRSEALNHFHRGLVGTTVQRAAQCADGCRDAGIQVRKRRRADAGGEGRGIEFVLGVQNQRDVHDLAVQFAGGLVEQQVQKMPADGVFCGGAVDTLAVMTEAIPVADDRRERCEQTVG
ncbi:hypothetical protein ALP66_02365 [Pseudomonas amygdali pv. photiniae]|uniref:Uncharacterized protein n=1 Tax=Pseudomonas amygdali pv. photiniae TaxID=251724 RepID=A0A658KAK9_PSEA0|nr:hypothetical protein ALP66_02365 [Pseudomonas amygdali pv. photiniae]